MHHDILWRTEPVPSEDVARPSAPPARFARSPYPISPPPGHVPTLYQNKHHNYTMPTRDENNRNTTLLISLCDKLRKNTDGIMDPRLMQNHNHNQ